MSDGERAAIVRGQSGEQISSNNNSWVWIILALTRGRSRGRSSLVTTNNKLSGDNQELTSIYNSLSNGIRSKSEKNLMDSHFLNVVALRLSKYSVE